MCVCVGERESVVCVCVCVCVWDSKRKKISDFCPDVKRGREKLKRERLQIEKVEGNREREKGKRKGSEKGKTKEGT